MSKPSTLIISADKGQVSCSVWVNSSQRIPRHLEAVELNKYNFSVHGYVYFVGIYQLVAELLAKTVHIGKDELTVGFLDKINGYEFQLCCLLGC